ncbi:MAG: Ig-like domain-containing protein [Planctomycetota bacterium]
MTGPATMVRIRQLSLLLLSAALGALLGGCDNIGRAFDPSVDPNDPSSDTGESTVQVVPAGGIARDGRPQVRAAYPEDGGWPRTVPIVVEFSESVNEASLLPTTPNGIDGRIGVRIQGSTELLPAQYDFLANGRLLIIRPIGGLPANPAAFYETVLFPEGRDTDGVRFQVAGDEEILTEFQVNQDESFTDGRILALFPRDNADLERESSMLVVFDRAANLGSLQTSNLFVTPVGGAAIDFTIRQPLVAIGIAVNDTRIIELDPSAALEPNTQFEFTVTSNITFGLDGNLDFNGRTPFSVYDSVGPAVPTLVELGNSVAGFENQISQQNFATTQLAVTTPVDALIGDTVVARIYGGDAATTGTFDLAFLERTVSLTAGGEQTVLVDFSNDVGAIGNLALDEGELSFAASLVRGSDSTGFVLNPETADPTLDVTPPEFESIDMPGDGSVVLADTEHAALYGVASEQLAEVSVASSATTTGMVGSDADGRFLTRPVLLPRGTMGDQWSLTLIDLAGNESQAQAGFFTLRGAVTGAQSGSIVIEAYDESTLEPVVGASVLIEDGGPSSPPVNPQLTTTDLLGRATATIAAGPKSVTIVAEGYDLITMAATNAGFVSLPLRPIGGASADLVGTVGFEATGSETVLIGTSSFASERLLAVESSSASPTSIPMTSVLANRPQIVTAFGGQFEPTGNPTFTLQACQICGPGLLQPTAPVPPVAAGEEVTATLFLTGAVSPPVGLNAPHTEDFGLAGDLDLMSLVGGVPRSRVMCSLEGFRGQVLGGVGAVTGGAGTTFSIEPDFAVPILVGFALFGGVVWLLTEAEDTEGRLSRTRVLVATDLIGEPVGSVLPGIGVTAIPSIMPVSPFTGPPVIEFDDVLNSQLAPGGAGITLVEVVTADSAGRQWRILVPDRDPNTGTDTVQFPDLASQGLVGLTGGSWTTVVEARLFVSSTLASLDDFVLTERFRQEVNYARSAPVTLTVP